MSRCVKHEGRGGEPEVMCKRIACSDTNYHFIRE